MNDRVFDDLKMILKDSDLLGEFIKIDDVKEMYDFCKNVYKRDEPIYTEKEFSETVDDLIKSLPEDLYGDNEW